MALMQAAIEGSLGASHVGSEGIACGGGQQWPVLARDGALGLCGQGTGVLRRLWECHLRQWDRQGDLAVWGQRALAVRVSGVPVWSKVVGGSWGVLPMGAHVLAPVVEGVGTARGQESLCVGTRRGSCVWGAM